MKKNLFLAALALVALAGCSTDAFVGDSNSPDESSGSGAIVFGLDVSTPTRNLTGATAAEILGGMFVVEGTKGFEETNSPSTTVVFDNYLVGYDYNSAAKTESNTHNWEYVGKQTGISGKLSVDTWTALHSGATDAKSQTIKYWDYSTDQYDFIAWSTGKREAVTDDAESGSKVKVTRINTGSNLATNGFTLTALSAADLQQCYYTDINTVKKADNKYGLPVTLEFKNMAAKVRLALYETVPGYSVKDVKFYTSDANPTAPTDLGTGTLTTATLFTMGSDALPQSGEVTVMYPHIGTGHRDANPQTADYNKASVSVQVTAGSSTATSQNFGTIQNEQLKEKQANETEGTVYLGRNLTEASFAGLPADNYYTAVIPNTNGHPLTLRVDYTLVSTDGSGEEIKVYGAKAVVPATYAVWQPNYAYTYIFKISDNSNGWTNNANTDPKGLFPITFDAVVVNTVDANAEQTTVTTVATPSITTYQQGHDHQNKDEYSKSQTAGASSEVKDLYVQVMNNSGVTPTLVSDLKTTGKSLLFSVSKADASEAEVMDALQNRTNLYNEVSPIGRNGIALTKNDNISNTVTSIINGVDDQPITQIAGANITAGQVAKIDIDQLATGTYAYVYCTTVPSSDEKVYHVAAATSSNYSTYYEVAPTNIASNPCASESIAAAGKVYFVKNFKADGTFDSWTFKQTKVGDNVAGLYEAPIPDDKATSYNEHNFYFDVYNRNNGAYAVKVIKVVD